MERTHPMIEFVLDARKLWRTDRLGSLQWRHLDTHSMCINSAKRLKSSSHRVRSYREIPNHPLGYQSWCIDIYTLSLRFPLHSPSRLYVGRIKILGSIPLAHRDSTYILRVWPHYIILLRAVYKEGTFYNTSVSNIHTRALLVCTLVTFTVCCI